MSSIAGHSPSVAIKPHNPEAAKYAKLWQRDEYRAVAPGEQWANFFLERARPERGAEIIDFGCGTGRGALMLALLGGLNVTMLDFVEHCLDPEVAQACQTQPHALRFELADLTRPLPRAAAYGFCCDVLEHIPTVDVPAVLRHILASAQHAFLAISTVQDRMGALIGEELHLTVQPLSWWLERLKEAGAIVHWAHEFDECCAVYCSSWGEAAQATKSGKVNVGETVIDSQVRENVLAGWGHVVPHQEQDREIVLLAGGPSMAGQLDKIRELREAGCALVTVNGAYGWAIEQGLVPSAQIVLDGREFNARFVQPVVETCRYLIASQVHPATLAALPRERTLLWHSGLSDENEALVREKAGAFFPVLGGSTVVLRAIPLMRMLGFSRMHVFGFDSCVRADGAHHSYIQAENDGEAVIPVVCGGRTFQCAPWMVSQASEFRDLVRFLGDAVELGIYGDGLIAHMLATGASFNAKD